MFQLFLETSTQLTMTRTAPSTRTGRTGQRADPRVLAHFQASAALYKLWSREGHLHFGYWRWPMSPLDRAAMLEEHRPPGGAHPEAHAR